MQQTRLWKYKKELPTGSSFSLSLIGLLVAGLILLVGLLIVILLIGFLVLIFHVISSPVKKWYCTALPRK